MFSRVKYSFAFWPRIVSGGTICLGNNLITEQTLANEVNLQSVADENLSEPSLDSNKPYQRKAMEPKESNKTMLFSRAMKEEWDKVIEMIKQDASLLKARIASSGHTALHIAVTYGKEHVVKQMVDDVSQTQPDDNRDQFIKALRTGNHRNNTALHLAAFMGNATMCHIIASVEPTLVDDRNVDGETPLFLAALYGRKQAFLCLHSIRNAGIANPPFYDNCRRNNGDTILHSAINGDHFDLAFQIIHLYHDLAYCVNEEGLSPLHLLAAKPCAFGSGTRLGRMETIIYRCIYVEELKADPAYEHRTCQSEAKDSGCHYVPDNNNTLWDLCRPIRKVVTVVSKPVKVDEEDPGARGSQVDGGRANLLFPVNYRTCCDLFNYFFYLVLLIVLGQGSEKLRKIYRKKETHTWSVQIVKQLLHYASLYEYEDDGSKPQEGYSALSQELKRSNTKDKHYLTMCCQNHKNHLKICSSNYVFGMPLNCADGEQNPKTRTKETPILVAAKNGVMEIIEKIVESFPVAIHDMNEDKKNIVLLAVEHRQPHVYQFLLKNNFSRKSLFHQVDKDGNSALHLAATLLDNDPWLIPGEALQMQWEHKWYQFVNETMPPDFVHRYNNKGETPDVVFTNTHKELTNRAAKWLNKASGSCSVVAALVATVAFATAVTVPGGVQEETGSPTLEDEVEFQLFAFSALIALGCSIAAMVMFLSILTSRFQEQDFNKNLPIKLLVGLTSLFVSIASMLMSFCAGHFFVIKNTLLYLALPIYVATCLPVHLFVLAQLPLYFDLLRATFKHVAQRSCRPSA